MRRWRCTSEIDGRRVCSTSATAWSYIGSDSASAPSTLTPSSPLRGHAAFEDAVEVLRPALRLQVLDDLVHLGIGHERAVHAQRIADTRRLIEHVALPQQRFGAHVIEDRARVDLARHLERDPRRNVGLDEAR